MRLAGKDMGASMCYGLQHRNRQMQTRILDVQPFWNKLRKLNIALWYKLLVVHTALFPRSLHGCAQVTFGWRWIIKLRTWTMRGLRVDRAGANPALRLACVLPILTDPGFYDCWTTWRTFFQQMMISRGLRNSWARYIELHDGKRGHGPFTKILDLCAWFGWTISADLLLGTDFGCFDLLLLTKQHLRKLVEFAWRCSVAGELGHRRDYAGLAGIDYHASFFKPRNLDRTDSALLDCIRDVTCFLNTFKSKFDISISCLCEHCGQEDTLQHRALSGGYYAEERAAFPDCVGMWSSCCVALTHHGISSEPAALRGFWRELTALPGIPTLWHGAPVSGSVQHIFTDGSCTDARVPTLALASWACVHADGAVVLQSGLLPGMLQNNARAELYAVIVAMAWCRFHACSAIVYTDCAYVKDGYDYLCRHGAVPSAWKDEDLWELVLQLLASLDGIVTLIKTSAHVDVAALVDVADSDLVWQAHWNEAADVAAKSARMNAGTAGFRKLYDELCVQHLHNRNCSRRFQLFLLALAKKALIKTPDLDDEDWVGDDFFLTASPNTGDFLTLCLSIHIRCLVNMSR